MTVFIDIETRSRADLPEVGAYRYGVDPSTEVLMMAVTDSLPSGDVHLWVNPKYEAAGVASDPMALKLLRNADEVVAHNAGFELAVLHGKNFDPYIPLDKWHCTQAMARIAGVPESLEKVGAALGLATLKNPKGKALIRKFSIPQEDGTFCSPMDFPEDWKEFCDYCRRDVDVEREVWFKLKEFRLTGENWETWQFTLRMNEVGIPVNVDALKNAQAIIEETTKTARDEFRQLTGLNPTQRGKVLEWLKAKGVAIEDMQAETLGKVLADFSLPSDVRQVVSRYAELSFAAVKKVDAMLKWACPDNRMHGVFKFYGTGTGRWSAGGPQIQNAKKATPSMRPVTKAAYAAISNGATASEIDAVYGNPIEVISSCIRHFVHAPGSKMLDADYNAIEARIACWLSNDVEAIKEYQQGIDRYRIMAGLIFDKPPKSVTSDERDIGKQAILGLSYGMGATKFRTSCEAKGINISEELAERAKNAFRRKHRNMVDFWRELEEGSKILAVGGAAKFMPSGSKSGLHLGIEHLWTTYLTIRLPSGRKLYYQRPTVREKEYGKTLSYFGQLPMSSQWGEIDLYGAKIFENICQAIAADLMSYGAREAERHWMLPFALIHDQALAIQNVGQTSDQFAAALNTLPSWASRLPLKAEAKVTDYYSK